VTTCHPYYGTGTTCDVPLNAGDTIELGTCKVPGSQGSGDTTVALKLGVTLVASNDNSAEPGCNSRLSFLRYTVGVTGLYTIQGGCNYGGTTTHCSGTVAYRIIYPSTPPALLEVDTDAELHDEDEDEFEEDHEEDA